MTFQERLIYYIESQGEDFAALLAGSGFAFDLEFGGEKIGFRRKSDAIREDGRVLTTYLVFPQNGNKKRMFMGCEMDLVGEPEDLTGPLVRFRSAAPAAYRAPGKGDVYHAQAASRTGRSLQSQGYNTYLHHDFYVHTPEKEVSRIEDFDFDAHPLFMLGLLGNEYQIKAVLR